MLRDITLGQYYPVKSKIHELDPRVKLVATLIYIISLFILNNIVGFLLATIFLVIVVKMSKVPFSFMVKGLRAIVILMIFTAILNMIFTPGDEAFHIWKISISYRGLYAALLMMIRLSYLIVGTSIMTLTTTPNRLTDGLESLLKGLKKIKVPVHEIALMMSIALRFIPILVEETDKIMKAQMARGADFESGGIIKKAKNLLPLLVPLFISAFRRANDLALAMESRCYMGGDGRTKMKPLKYSTSDIHAYIFLFMYLILMIISRIIWGRFF
ncbi:MAG: energy-coupling factor transporter transmembrane protein EcfT [Eubacterium sp.]|nr:energy-coupling factor transporter transmembrane protein EcfT [Eubacterium sp.]